MDTTPFIIGIAVVALCLSAVACAAVLVLLAAIRQRGRRESSSQAGAGNEGGALPLVPLNPANTGAIPESEQAFLTEVLTGRPSFPIRYEEVPLTSQLKTTLQAVVQQAPNMAGTAGGALVLSRAFLLWFPPQFSRALADGTLSLMQSRALAGGVRAIAVGADGKIVANATLLPTAAASAVGAGLLVWQVMAVVTAQKFLAEINARLARLETEIKSVKNWLVNDRLGKLLGNLEYLRRISGCVLEDGIADKDMCGPTTHRGFFSDNAS